MGGTSRVLHKPEQPSDRDDAWWDGAIDDLRKPKPKYAVGTKVQIYTVVGHDRSQITHHNNRLSAPEVREWVSGEIIAAYTQHFGKVSESVRYVIRMERASSHYDLVHSSYPQERLNMINGVLTGN